VVPDGGAMPTLTLPSRDFTCDDDNDDGDDMVISLSDAITDDAFTSLLHEDDDVGVDDVPHVFIDVDVLTLLLVLYDESNGCPSTGDAVDRVAPAPIPTPSRFPAIATTISSTSTDIGTMTNDEFDEPIAELPPLPLAT
jgi:hypothetical protein